MYNTANFSTYIYRVLKQVHPDQGLSGDGLVMINNIVRILLLRSMNSVNRVMVSTGTKTISSREVRTSVCLLFPDELSKHAVSEGTKSVTRYNAFKKDTPPKKSEKVEKAAPSSRSFSAGLTFPVTRVENIMRSLSNVERISGTAAVYMAAVLEYVTAELLEIAGRVTAEAKKMRITPRHIKLAILNDTELTRLFSGVVLSGGVAAHVEESLIKHKSRSTKKVSKPESEKEAPKKAPAKKKPPAKTKGGKKTTKTVAAKKGGKKAVKK